MKNILKIMIIAVLVGVCFTAYSEELTASDKFDKAMEVLEAADNARDNDQNAEARRLYRDSLDRHVDISSRYPGWQPGVVAFRLAYSEEQLEKLMRNMDLKIDRANDPPTPGTARISVENNDLGDIPDRVKLLLKNGRASEARDLLLEGVSIDPDSSDIRLLMGIAQCQDGKYEDAVYLLVQLIKDEPRNANAYITLGAAYFGLNHTESAIEKLKRALELEPNLSAPHYNLAQMFLALDPPDKMAAEYHYIASRELGGLPDVELEVKLK